LTRLGIEESQRLTADSLRHKEQMRDVRKYEVFQLADELVPGYGRRLTADG
jgi:hypothetical protein